MDFAIWTEKLSVDIDLIDNQHKKLIIMINNIAQMILKQNETEVKDILNGLKEYTVTHFSEEEDLFGKSAYPDIEKHIKEHGYFIHKLDEFEKDYKLNEVSVSLDILQFLKNWLFYHIEIVDNTYSSYVKKMM